RTQCREVSKWFVISLLESYYFSRNRSAVNENFQKITSRGQPAQIQGYILKFKVSVQNFFEQIALQVINACRYVAFLWQVYFEICITVGSRIGKNAHFTGSLIY